MVERSQALTGCACNRGLAPNIVSEHDQRGENQRKRPEIPFRWARQYALVLEFLIYLAVLGYIGIKVDARYGSEPWGLFGGLMLGTAVGLYRMIREAQKMER